MFNVINNSIKNNLKKFKFIRLLLYKIRPGYKKYQVFDFLSKDSIFIDIGANIGEVTDYINDKTGCKIFCYEPHPGAFNYLKNKLKNKDNIFTFNYAVSDKDSEQDFYLHKDSLDSGEIKYSQASSLESDKENISQNKKITVKSIHINNILKKFEKIDCIKIDIEGHEYKILPFLIENKNLIKKVVCELHGSNSKFSQKIKNPQYKPKYDYLISVLKKENLYNSWFIEWE